MLERYITIIMGDKPARGFVSPICNDDSREFFEKEAEAGNLNILYDGPDLPKAVAELNKATGMSKY